MDVAGIHTVEVLVDRMLVATAEVEESGRIEFPFADPVPLFLAPYSRFVAVLRGTFDPENMPVLSFGTADMEMLVKVLGERSSGIEYPPELPSECNGYLKFTSGMAGSSHFV